MLIFSGCGEQPDPEEVDVFWHKQELLLYHGIPVRVNFHPNNYPLAKETWDYLRGIDDQFNDYRGGTDISDINDLGAHTEINISKQFGEALILCQEAHKLTDGAFDPTIRPLRQLWKDAEKSKLPPTPDAIKQSLTACGMDNVELLASDIMRKKRAETKLDFGGIIKGIAVDNAVAKLKAGGADAGLVQIGGETAVWGMSQRGKPHAIAIQHPINMRKFWTVLEDDGSGFSCATSGNYRNPIKIGDELFYHVIDPRTGQPVDTKILSVTIIFPETGKNGLADALSTAGTVLGPEKILKLAQDQGAEALVLTQETDGIREHRTLGFRRFERQ